MDAAYIQEVRRFRRALKRCYLPFFASYGTPNSIQLAALKPLLTGGNVLIVAPTATGKTEAAIAPLVERWMDPRDDQLAILYLAPTKALCKEMGERLGAAVGVFKKRVGVRTGDRRTATARPPMILITTVESFDSMMARNRDLLAQVRAVLIDEIHMIHGNARGDQLMVLLRRLEDLTGRSLQKVGLSATLSDPEVALERYLGTGQIIVGEGRRAIRLKCVRDLEDLVSSLRQEGLRRILCFAKTRQGVEKAAAEIKKLVGADRTLVHHAGLTARERHRVEEAMRTLSSWFCVATSTLEVGIDVGAIEAIGLIDVPLSPSAFQQRVGRGGRRDAVIRVFGVAPTDERRHQLEHLAAMADEGKIEDLKIETGPGVVVQQCFSMLFARPSGVVEDEILDKFEGIAPRVHLRTILDHLVQEGYVIRARSKLMATSKVMDLGVRGTVHANLPDAREVQIVDASTGRNIGSGKVSLRPGTQFSLGGKSWMVVNYDRGRLQVAPAGRTAEGAQGGGSRGKGDPWTPYLPVSLRAGFPASKVKDP
jgi:ATP-dependent Lhr-like helicase